MIEINSWNQRGRLRFYNQKGEILLEEPDSRGALNTYARHFKSNIGGDYHLTVEFEADTKKLYGMGQYQQEIFDIKHCHFELAHRNSQASIPFVLSSLGF